MNFLSINARGIGGPVKEGWIKGLKLKNKVDFLMIQETKLSDLSKLNVMKFWGNQDYGTEVVEATGLSGGLLCIWDIGIFEISGHVKNRNFLMVNRTIKGSQLKINIINVYAPQRTADKLCLWNKIREVMNGVDGMWVIAGDFNAVRSQDERKNSSFKNVCARNFNEFIFEENLMEYDLKGRKFTCIRDNGRKMSKIDRFLVCQNFFNHWLDACLRGMSFSHSDHCPLLLTVNRKNFGAKPFRVYNSWMGMSGFREVVEMAANLQDDGNYQPDIKLMRKFHKIRDAIKEWRLEVSKKEEEAVLKAKEELEDLEKIMEERDLSDVEEWELVENKNVMMNFEFNKCDDMKQKSRIKWAIEGDENTKFCILMSTLGGLPTRFRV
ncbi:uncharacterized protein LOC110932111 [Helianthus annuus]|uniref:uncharacterized protein LOC110932111 n=1 Tax=Helianthus annuus TaxID=4232 RepID=UPI000B907569|nr:uncharacterized protein LOC110932111 [Helianthus annuus]